MAEYDFTHVGEEDLPDIISVIGRSRKGLPFERTIPVEEMRAYTFGDPDFHPEGTWVVRAYGRPVAYAFVIIEPNRLSAGLDDAYMEFEVVPEERGKGLEQRLLGATAEYIRSQGVGKVRTRCMVVEAWRRDLLVADGFAEAYSVYSLVRKGREQVAATPAPPGIDMVRRPFKECGDEELTRVVEAFNVTFQDHFSFAPERPERFIHFRDANPDSFIISLAMRGDEIVGVCLSEESVTYNREHGEKAGWVNILGVKPEYRRMGLGRCLLADGMRWILDQGMDTIYIGVYANNEKALVLYTSLGFQKAHESKWFERRLR